MSDDPSGFRRAADLFLRVRGMAPPRRERFLARIGRRDPALRAAVDKLLAGERQPLPVESLARDVAEARRGTESPQGRRAGRYRLAREIGSGGFGTVYEAEQTHPVRRRVALKVLREGVATDEVVARFEAERQTLARLDHPHITKVLDAGTHDGRPYYAMELVRGEPITEYCRRHQLPARDRVELFLPVCEAVHHAHERGIIHRDLKPGNVLVTLRGNVPVPTIIDFGIAKELHQPLRQRRPVTQTRQFLGTPDYMSPEQAEMSELDIDARTDVYALGVLLYEVLTGARPFDAWSLADAIPSEVQRVLREVDPPRPSTHVPGPPVQARELRGDLDWIVLKCIEKDRTRRYETAQALMTDLRRHLAHQPVVASPPGALYRLRKAARRHAAALYATGSVILALAVGLGLALWGMLEARDDRDRLLEARKLLMAEMAAAREAEKLAAEERGRAEEAMRLAKQRAAEAMREAAKTRVVNDFLKEMLESADPGRGGPDVTVLDVVGRAARRVEMGALADSPESEAAVRSALGRAYLALARHEDARRQFEAALRLRRKLHGPAHAEVAIALTDLADHRRARDDVAGAESLLREARSIWDRADVHEHAAAARTLHWLAEIHLRRREFEAAESLVEKAQAIRRRQLGKSHVSLALGERIEARLLAERRQLAKALEYLERALGRFRDHYGAPHLEIARTLDLMSGFRAALGDLEKAEALGREAYSVAREIYGREHPDTARSLDALGGVLALRGRDAEAERAHREALRVFRATLPAGHINVGGALHNLANALVAQRRFGEALAMQREALAIFREAYGPGHASTLPATLLCADLLLEAGDAAGAESILLEQAQGLPPGPSRGRRELAKRIVRALEAQNRAAEAAPWKAAAEKGD